MKYVGYLLICHILGWMMTGYFVTRLLAGRDIRLEGSGNMGALNSGRAAGAKGFLLTFLGDALKGGIAAALGIALDFPDTMVLSGLALTVAGHIWPLPFNFRGGKGVAAFLGGLGVYHPAAIVFIILAFSFLYILLREFTVSGLGAILLWPVFELVRGSSGLIFFIQLALMMLIMTAHRSNIRKYWEERGKER